MMPLDLADRLIEMERARRARQRLFAVAWIAVLGVALATAGGIAWLVLHPEATGAFSGRIAAAASDAS